MDGFTVKSKMASADLYELHGNEVNYKAIQLSSAKWNTKTEKEPTHLHGPMGQR